jgi:flagella basal body P-ring formation protein FlgA
MIFAQPVENWHGSRPQSDVARHRQASAPLVRPGRPAFLIFDSPQLHISVRVQPLNRAGLGETVKVLDPSTHRKWLAEVKGTDLLQAQSREAK